MRKLVFLMAAVFVFASLFFLMVPSSQAQNEGGETIHEGA